MKKKLALLLAALIGVTTILGGCGNKEKSDDSKGGQEAEGGGGTFIVRAVGDPISFNPDMVGDDNGYPIAQNIYVRLCGLDASKQNLVPEAAESWSYNDDATELTFKLRQDLKWTDGEALTSEDVKYTFDTIKATPSYYFSSSLAGVSSIETPDDYTVIFKLSRPDASLASILGWYATFILPEHIYNNGQPWEDNPANMDPVSCGPFKLEEYKQGESVTLVKNPDFPEPAKLDKLIFSIIPDEATAIQALKNGEIDFFENMPTASAEELKNDDSVRIMYNEYPSPLRLVFNMNDEKVGDLALRKAIATAIDRDEISEKVFSGVQKPEYSMYPSQVTWAANTEDVAPSFNIDEARKILEDAGYKADADGMYVTGLVLDVFEGSGYPDSAKLIQATLKEAGIGMELNVQEYSAWEQKVFVERDFQIEFQGGFMGPDPVALTNRIGTDSSGNVGGYSNAQVDEFLAKGVATGNQDERAGYYKEAQKILAEELPYVNVVSFAGPEANSTRFINLPSDGEGKWAWANYGYTELVK